MYFDVKPKLNPNNQSFSSVPQYVNEDGLIDILEVVNIIDIILRNNIKKNVINL